MSQKLEGLVSKCDCCHQKFSTADLVNHSLISWKKRIPNESKLRYDFLLSAEGMDVYAILFEYERKKESHGTSSLEGKVYNKLKIQ